MSVRDLVPLTRANDRNRNLPAAQEASASPLFTLHREMNRLFDDVFRGFDAPSLSGGLAAWPQLEVQASAVQDEPRLRWLLGTVEPVPLDAVRAALRRLDEIEGGHDDRAH